MIQGGKQGGWRYQPSPRPPALYQQWGLEGWKARPWGQVRTCPSLPPVPVCAAAPPLLQPALSRPLIQKLNHIGELIAPARPPHL